jgi:hypothetical protein
LVPVLFIFYIQGVLTLKKIIPAPKRLKNGTWNVRELTGLRKTQGKWVVETGGRVTRIEVAGDICLWRQSLSQGCTADDDIKA